MNKEREYYNNDDIYNGSFHKVTHWTLHERLNLIIYVIEWIIHNLMIRNMVLRIYSINIIINLFKHAVNNSNKCNESFSSVILSYASAIIPIDLREDIIYYNDIFHIPKTLLNTYYRHIKYWLYGLQFTVNKERESYKNDAQYKLREVIHWKISLFSNTVHYCRIDMTNINGIICLIAHTIVNILYDKLGRLNNYLFEHTMPVYNWYCEYVLMVLSIYNNTCHSDKII